MIRYGKERRSILTDTVHSNGYYQLWSRGPTKGRYPKHDFDSIADDMQCIFSIPFRRNMIREARTRARNEGYALKPTPDFCPSELECKFLVCLRKVLVARGVESIIKAKGKCHRRSNSPWSFSTDEYLIYANTNGLLLKLIGLENVEREAWEMLFNDCIGISGNIILE